MINILAMLDRRPAVLYCGGGHASANTVRGGRRRGVSLLSRIVIRVGGKYRLFHLMLAYGCTYEACVHTVASWLNRSYNARPRDCIRPAQIAAENTQHVAAARASSELSLEQTTFRLNIEYKPVYRLSAVSFQAEV